MKYKSIRSLFIVAFIACFSIFSSYSSANAASSVKEWTFMIFMAGDNNLEGGTSIDVNELERYGSSSKVNFVVQIDRNGGFSEDSEFKWSGTKRFYVKKDNNVKKMTSPMVKDLGEVDMSKPKALLDFVKWSKKNYPAKKYALVLWNHGTGWKEIQPSFMEAPSETFVMKDNSGISNVMDNISYNISYDDTSHDSMNIPTLHGALLGVKKILGKPIDLLGFDACLMQMAEVADAAAESALFQVGAPDQEPERGWPYDLIAKALVKQPTMGPKTLGEAIVSNYKKSYSQGGSQGNKAVILSLFNLTKLNDFKSKLDDFCLAFRKNVRDITRFEQARERALKYSYGDYIDLGHFLNLIMRTNVNAEIKSTARSLYGSIISKNNSNSLVVKVGKTGAKFQQATGIAVFFPDRNGFKAYAPRYKMLSFSRNTEWFDFIREVSNPNIPYIKLESMILDDANKDGRVAPGEVVSVSLVVNNYGRKALVGPLVTSKTRSRYLNAKIFKSKTSFVIKPGRHKISKVFKFKVSKDVPIHTEIPMTISISGKEMPVSTIKTSFSIKKSFASTGHALLVISDLPAPAKSVIQSMFKSAKIKFDIWDRAHDGEMKPDVLKRYLKGWVFVVVQNSPQALSENEIAALEGFLKAGGRLVLDGQDIAFSLRDTDFLENMCKVKFVQDDVNVHVVNAVNDFAGNQNFQIFGGDGANNQKWPDEIDPLRGAKAIIEYDEGARDIADESEMEGPDVKPDSLSKGIKSSGVAGVVVVNGYRLILFAFGVEAVNSKIQRNRIMQSIASIMQPPVQSEIRNYAGASRRSLNSAPTLESMDMLSAVENRLMNEIKTGLELNPNIAKDALNTIKMLPNTEQEAVKGLEKNIRSLLEFNREHGNLRRR